MPRYALVIIAMLISSVAQAVEITRVLVNGNIITQDETRPHAKALAISGDKIFATGTNEAMRALTSSQTQVIDLGGRTVIPGLIDSHIHAIRAGLTFSTEVSWIDVPDLKIALQRISEAANATSTDEWIVVAGGWNVQQFSGQRSPSLADIESAAPGRAVYIQLAYNSVLISSEGLRRLNITDEADLPEGARFVRASNNEPTGWIAGNAPSIIAMFDRLPKFDRKKHIEGTQRFFRRLNQFGITGVIDPGGHNLKPSEYDALFEMASRNELSLRIAFSAFAPSAGHEREDLEYLASVYRQHHHPLLQFNGLGECITWGFYNNNAPAEAQTREFESVAMWAASQGLRVTIHWNNDESAHVLLDVFERINAQYPLKDLRWSIAHLHDGSRATLERMHKLGLGWLAQNAGYFAAPSWVRARGDKLAETPPLASALRMGMPVGGGTDAHRVMSYNPFLSLRWMIDGVTAGGLTTRDASERLTREQALRIYTNGSAWFTGDEGKRGRLMAGYDADFAVLDRNYLTAPLSEFGVMQSLLTIVGGRIVYADGALANLEDARPDTSVSTDPAPRR